jgi:hypothetical protein
MQQHTNIAEREVMLELREILVSVRIPVSVR